MAGPRRLPQLQDRAFLQRLYWTDLRSTREIARELGCSRRAVVAALRAVRVAIRSGLRERCTERTRRRIGESARARVIGQGNPRWRGGVGYRKGYRMLLVPRHPNADARGYVCEHRLVMSRHLGRALTPAEVVHHRNHCRTDNRLANLQLFPTSAAHARVHAAELRAARGRPPVRRHRTARPPTPGPESTP